MKRNKRSHAGKPQGMTYADQMARSRMIKEATQLAANDTMVHLLAEATIQKNNWIFMVSVNKCFKAGKVGFERLSEAINDVTEWYEKIANEDGADVANEKLRQEAERVTKQEIEFIWEDKLAEAYRKRSEKRISNFERLRIKSMEKMAETLCEWIDCAKCPGREMCSHRGEKANGLKEWLEADAEGL